MSFEAFERAIVSPALKQVARHWNAVRGPKAMPGWSDIQPSQIAAQLPILWAYKYDRAEDSFIGRLAGDQIERIFGKNFRGLSMVEIYSPEDYPRLFARSKRVTCEPALFRSEGTVFQHVDHFGQGERIMLPLASDGRLGDGLLGATYYQVYKGTYVPGGTEVESWFAL